MRKAQELVVSEQCEAFVYSFEDEREVQRFFPHHRSLSRET